MSKIFMTLTKPGYLEREFDKGGSKSRDIAFRRREHYEKVSPPASDMADMLSAIVTTEATDNLWGERCSKVCQNAMSNPLQAMSGFGSAQVLSSEIGRVISIHFAAEPARIGLKLGYQTSNFGGAASEKWANADRPSTYKELDRHLTLTARIQA